MQKSFGDSAVVLESRDDFWVSRDFDRLSDEFEEFTRVFEQ